MTGEYRPFRDTISLPTRLVKGDTVLRSLTVRNFTVFEEADLRFVRGLNVILGENGTGKTHLLKLPYAVMATSADEGRKGAERPTKAVLQTRVAEKVVNIFRSEERLGRLARRRTVCGRCQVPVALTERDASIDSELPKGIVP